jgi:hypothetical protein
VKASPIVGVVAVTTISGFDTVATEFGWPTGTSIFGPFEAGFGAEADELLFWLGCDPPSNGYIIGGIDTKTTMEMMAFQCGVQLPRIENDVYVNLMFSCGAHSVPNGDGCTSPPGGQGGYTACVEPSYHFHQDFSCLQTNNANSTTGHSGQVIFVFSKKCIFVCNNA